MENSVFGKGVYINGKNINKINNHIIGYFIYNRVFDVDNLPKGELKKTVKSPNRKYEVRLYLCDGGATTDYAVRGGNN